MIDPRAATPMQRRVREASRQAGIELFLRSEVAAELDVTVTTLKRWAAIWEGAAPSFALQITPKLTVHLYTAENVARCEVAKSHFAATDGRKKWTPEQRADRQRLLSMRTYYRRGLRLYLAEGNGEAEAVARINLGLLQGQLDSMVPRGAARPDVYGDVP